MAASIAKGQIPVRVKGQTTCLYHHGRQLDLYCKTCSTLACVKCLSTVHEAHIICDIAEVTPQKKRDVQDFINETENHDLVQTQQFILSTESHLKDNISNFEKLSAALKKQANILKQDIDLMTAQTLSLYHQMEEDNKNLLQKYKQDLEMHASQLQQQVQECKNVLQRGSHLQIYDTGCEVQSRLTLPVKPSLRTASFTPNNNPKCHLEQALGTVTKSTSPDRLLPKTRSTPQYQLLPEAKVVGEFKSPSTISSLCPTTAGKVWICYSSSKTATLLDRKGQVMKKIEHKTNIKDISMSSTTDTLWTFERGGTSIMELVSGTFTHRFSTKEEPWCLCVTASNHIIVGERHQIIKYTTQGTAVLTTKAGKTGKPLVCLPWRISGCPVTQNIAVSDWDNEGFGGDGKPHIVVLDTHFNELFQCDAEIPSTHQQTTQTKPDTSYPLAVVFDRVGNLVIGDRNRNNVLLISGDGDFLRVLYTGAGLGLTSGVCVDMEGVVWAVFEHVNVKLLQYNSVQ